jgi:tight adherence protein B
MSIVVMLLFFGISFSVAAGVVLVISAARRNTSGPEEAAASSLALSEILKSEELSSISVWNRFLTSLNFTRAMTQHTAQADLNWSAGRVTASMLLSGTVALAIVWQISWLPGWLGLLVVPVATLAPYAYIRHRRNARFRKFRENLPDALDSMARALRAGAPVAVALDIVATETEAPVSTEVRRTFVEVNLGMPWDRALESLAQRIPIPEVNLFVSALQIHSRTGGKLGEVMNRLSESMRETNALEGEVRAIAAHGKLTGLVLTILPMGIAAMLFFVAPDYIKVLPGHPSGKHLIAAAAVCLVLAHLVIRKIVDIRV